MRVVAKLTSLLVLVIVWIIAVQTMRATQRLTNRHLSEMRDDLYILAGILSATADALGRGADREQMDAYLSWVNQHLPWVEVYSIPWNQYMNTISSEEFSTLPASSHKERFEFTDNALLARVRLANPDPPVMLEFHYSLAGHERYVDEVIERHLLYGGVLIGVGGAALFTLGIVFIGRPLRMLVRQTHHIASGDYSVRTNIDQHDEIGALASEVNRMSDRLQRAHARIDEAEAARAAALAQMRHADRLSTVGKLSSGMAHELGTPLNVISGRGQTILAHERCPPDIADNARIIVEQANTMVCIIRKSLDFVRRPSLGRKFVALDHVLQHARELLVPMAHERGISIEIGHTREVCVYVEEGQVLQLVTNLMINAIQAMPEGGRIYSSVDTADIDSPPSALAAPGRYACITIRDQGVGIPEDQLQRIFEPFFTTKERGQGTGLGLSVCEDIACDHGGWISVQSTLGQGSAFTVHLPVLPAANSAVH